MLLWRKRCAAGVCGVCEGGGCGVVGGLCVIMGYGWVDGIVVLWCFAHVFPLVYTNTLLHVRILDFSPLATHRHTVSSPRVAPHHHQTPNDSPHHHQSPHVAPHHHHSQVTERIRLKATTFGQDIAGTVVDPSSPPHYKVSPDEMADLYERWVMPMTKDVQVMYLLRRLDDSPEGAPDA